MINLPHDTFTQAFRLIKDLCTIRLAGWLNYRPTKSLKWGGITNWLTICATVWVSIIDRVTDSLNDSQTCQL